MQALPVFDNGLKILSIARLDLMLDLVRDEDTNNVMVDQGLLSLDLDLNAPVV